MSTPTHPHRTPARTVEVPVYAALTAVLLAAGAAIAFVVLLSYHLALLDALDHACSYDSVVARLDLTEWVPICLHPYDPPPTG